MSHIKLYPEEACYFPLSGKEAQCIEIIEYIGANVHLVAE